MHICISKPHLIVYVFHYLYVWHLGMDAGIILYDLVTSSLIGWAHAKDDPCECVRLHNFTNHNEPLLPGTEVNHSDTINPSSYHLSLSVCLWRPVCAITLELFLSVDVEAYAKI